MVVPPVGNRSTPSSESLFLVRMLLHHVLTWVVQRETKFASLPQVLVVHAKKFQLVNWVPAKMGTHENPDIYSENVALIC